MNLRKLSQTWETLGRDDPLWAVLSDEERREGRWDTEDFFSTGAAEIAQLTERMTRAGLALCGGRALDFGCGVGRITQALAAKYQRVDGVDISSPMLEQARRFSAELPTCHFTRNTRPDLKLFTDASFDFVYSRIVLQHMPTGLARRYIKEFARVMRPGGTLYFQLPTGWNLDSPQTYEKLRHHVTVPRGAYKALRRLVLLDWIRPPERKRHSTALEMEMHFTPMGRVLRLLEKEGLRLLEVARDDACGELIRSYNYLVVKPELAPARLHSRWAWRRIRPGGRIAIL